MSMKRFHEALRNFGCALCGGGAELHHIQERRDNLFIIPLCRPHHQELHRKKKSWRKTYGHEWEVFMGVRKLLKLVDKWPGSTDKRFLEYVNSPYASVKVREVFANNTDIMSDLKGEK